MDINIEKVTSGEISYDALNEHDQKIVREFWAEQIIERRSQLNYADEFTQNGQIWFEADDEGNVFINGEIR